MAELVASLAAWAEGVREGTVGWVLGGKEEEARGWLEEEEETRGKWWGVK